MYELAYHINQNLDEAEVKNRMREIESTVEQSGGTVVTSREPKKVRLSYSIAHQRGAYMGVLDFSGPTDMIKNIDAHLKLQEGILRFLIITKPEGKELRAFGEQRTRRLRTHTVVTGQTAEQKKEHAPGEEKEMEKKLEDVLEKL